MRDLEKCIEGYKTFKEKYYVQDTKIMNMLIEKGQKPRIMVIACCDSRVDPAILLQCDPGDLFVVRNVANIVPPYESDEYHHGTSAALEFAVCYLKVKHIIILGHSQCGGLNALKNKRTLDQDDFITQWVSLTQLPSDNKENTDNLAKQSLKNSYQNCFTFPWLKEKIEQKAVTINCWFFNINDASLESYNVNKNKFEPISE